MSKWVVALSMVVGMAAGVGGAEAQTCEQLRALCHTMRDDKSDCTKPYRRCLTSGVFVTPLGRVFRATR